MGLNLIELGTVRKSWTDLDGRINTEAEHAAIAKINERIQAKHLAQNRNGCTSQEYALLDLIGWKMESTRYRFGMELISLAESAHIPLVDLFLMEQGLGVRDEYERYIPRWAKTLGLTGKEEEVLLKECKPIEK